MCHLIHARRCSCSWSHARAFLCAAETSSDQNLLLFCSLLPFVDVLVRVLYPQQSSRRSHLIVLGLVRVQKKKKRRMMMMSTLHHYTFLWYPNTKRAKSQSQPQKPKPKAKAEAKANSNPVYLNARSHMGNLPCVIFSIPRGVGFLLRRPHHLSAHAACS